MLALILFNLAFAGNTVCINQDPKADRICILEDIELNGKKCKLEDSKTDFKSVLPGKAINNWVSLEIRWQCKLCFKCED